MGGAVFAVRAEVLAAGFLGLVAGWSIEPGSTVTVFVAFLFCAQFYREKKLTAWLKAGFISVLVGFVILMIAPGNFYRLELTNALEPDEIVTPEMFLINFVIGFLPVFVRELILFAPIIYYFAKVRTSEKVSRFIGGYAAASVLCVMMCLPEFPERAGFPSTIFLLIASVAALKEILPQLKQIYVRRERVANLAGNIILAVWILSVAGCLYVERNLNVQLSERMAIVEEHRADELIVVPPLEIPKLSETFLGTRTWDELALFWGGDLEPEVDGNRDKVFARYYGLKKIIAAERAE